MYMALHSGSLLQASPPVIDEIQITIGHSHALLSWSPFMEALQNNELTGLLCSVWVVELEGLPLENDLKLL